MHCFSMPEQLDECLRARLRDLVRRQRHLPKSAGDLAAAAGACPDERLLVETDAPYLTPQAVRKHRNQPAFVAHTVAFLAELRGVDARGARARRVERNAARAVRLVSDELRRRPASGRRPAEPAADAPLRRAPRPRARSELPDRLEHPRRDRARGRARARRTSCSRSAAGSGVLSEYLAARVAHVHVVEIDERLREALRDALGAARQRRAALGRRDDARPRRAAPAARRRSSRTCPTGSPRARSCARSRSCRRSSVGRDGPARGRRAAGRRARQRRLRRALGARPARLRGARRCARSRAPSSSRCRTSTRCSCGLERRRRARAPARVAGAARALVQRARFAHRRKTLAGSLRCPAGPPARWPRAGPRAPLRGARRSPDGRRAERLVARGVPRARRGARLDERRYRERWRRRRSTSACSSGPPRARRPARARHRDAVDLARRRAHARAAPPAGSERDEVLCPGVPDAPSRTSRRARSRRSATRTGWDAPPLRLSIDKRSRSPAGLGGGSADAAAALRLARRGLGAGRRGLLLELAARPRRRRAGAGRARALARDAAPASS